MLVGSDHRVVHAHLPFDLPDRVVPGLGGQQAVQSTGPSPAKSSGFDKAFVNLDDDAQSAV
jgi:hypothetical protein